MSQRYTVEVKRAWIMMGVLYAKTNLHSVAWSHKIVARVEEFLAKYPGTTYRITAECIDDEPKKEGSDGLAK